VLRFEKENDYFQTDCQLQKLQEKIINVFKQIGKDENSATLQKVFRIFLQMLDNARNFLQYHMSMRLGKAFFLQDRLDVKNFLEENIQKEAWERMDLTKVGDFTSTQRMAFVMLSNVFLQFREFYISLSEKILNMKVTRLMAENIVDRCNMSPVFEDEKGEKHESFEKYFEAHPTTKHKVVVLDPPKSDDENEFDEN
jgi:hypothetical protein